MSISVLSLTKIYGHQKAVDNISFQLAKGEIVGFLGPNGAGKSTTMKMITGYLPPTSGTAMVCGFDVQLAPMEVRKRVGYLPEANPLYYDMYVREYLGFSANIHKLKNASARIEEMIALTGLGKESHKKIGALSKGYKQRVGLAQAMLHDPEVLILDEPTSGLDPNQIIEIRELIKRIGQEKTVLLSTHIMQEVQAMCSRVIIINNGKLVANDAIDKLQYSKQENALIVTFEKPINEAVLKQLKNLQRYEASGPAQWRLITNKPEELRKEVMQWALNNDLSINSLQADKQSLEDIFRVLTK
ncbi:MAG: gliding motility-associated ABC transporter ATP-binding subunit GldA [Bacteroidetes bacterium]|nr:gliding motility-associated ABC transporter ATP-binding subunit GldA [Bacteroidota bacterium]